MTLKIEINLDNATFAPPTQGNEVARILRNLADHVEYETVSNFGCRLMDSNGDIAGKATVTL